MIISSCPLRISLFGGSTDHPEFIKQYGYGSVISFPCNLKTYVALSHDKLGSNYNNKYVLNYSRREEVDSLFLIKNELIRIVLQKLNIEPVSVFLTSDIYSHGSGLASSSSYIISLIKSINIYKNIQMTDYEICQLAYELEQEVNPYCGYQDPYGCGIGGFKRIEFFSDGQVKYQFLPTELFDLYDMHLIFTGITRNSKNILREISNNIDKSVPLLDTLAKAEKCLINKDYKGFFEYFNLGWSQKKKTVPVITENSIIKEIDNLLLNDKNIIGHKLNGAGNGGFFLTFSEKNTFNNSCNITYPYIKIDVSTTGVIGGRA